MKFLFQLKYKKIIYDANRQILIRQNTIRE